MAPPTRFTLLALLLFFALAFTLPVDQDQDTNQPADLTASTPYDLPPPTLNLLADLAHIDPSDLTLLRNLSATSTDVLFPHLEVLDTIDSATTDQFGLTRRYDRYAHQFDTCGHRKEFDSCGPSCVEKGDPRCTCCDKRLRWQDKPRACLKMKCCPCIKRKVTGFKWVHGGEDGSEDKKHGIEQD